MKEIETETERQRNTEGERTLQRRRERRREVEQRERQLQGRTEEETEMRRPSPVGDPAGGHRPYYQSLGLLLRGESFTGSGTGPPSRREGDGGRGRREG